MSEVTTLEGTLKRLALKKCGRSVEVHVFCEVEAEGAGDSGLLETKERMYGPEATLARTVPYTDDPSRGLPFAFCFMKTNHVKKAAVVKLARVFDSPLRDHADFLELLDAWEGGAVEIDLEPRQVEPELFPARKPVDKAGDGM
jgi:hypothetical protein